MGTRCAAQALGSIAYSNPVLTRCWPQIVPQGDKHSLAMVQRRLDTDILVTGHTHEFRVRCWTA